MVDENGRVEVSATHCVHGLAMSFHVLDEESGWSGQDGCGDSGATERSWLRYIIVLLPKSRSITHLRGRTRGICTQSTLAELRMPGTAPAPGTRCTLREQRGQPAGVYGGSERE